MSEATLQTPAPVITVDGPSGVGKGTLCRWLAARLRWHLLDSGALYRLTALAALRRDLPLEDEGRVATVAAGLDVEFWADLEGAMRIRLDGTEVGSELRSETCGDAASRVAALPMVRAALLQRQRSIIAAAAGFSPASGVDRRRSGYGNGGFSGCRTQAIFGRQRRRTRPTTI